jgi:ABC-type antimicrobial peptide transport system permease subunit
VKKGVAFAIVDALDHKSLALFVLILLVSALFLVNGAVASVRSRRSEIGTLLCLGWSRDRIFRAVLAEVAAVGVVAGTLGAGMAAILARILSLRMPLARTLLVIPVAISLATTAGLVAAWGGARGSPLDAVLPRVSERPRAQPRRSIRQMAWGNLRRLPGRTLLGGFALFLGVAALAALLSINLAFRGTLVGSLLGSFVSVQLRAVDYLSVVFALLLGGLAVADVLVLDMRERAAELAVLETMGWRRSHVGRLIAWEGLGVGLVGTLLGSTTGLALGSLLGADWQRLAEAVGLAAVAGLGISILVSLAAARFIRHPNLGTTLAEE